MDLFDVAVIGGGITGASSANHLAAAGYATLLLEQQDFAGATTGRTSRLQYSGLSYLGALNPMSQIARHPLDAVEALGLAKRSMRDRSAFIRAVPERVRPVTFFLPIYRGGPVSVRKMLLGCRLMERLDPNGVPLSVELIEPAAVRRDGRLRLLRDQDQLTGVIQCVEHQFNWPERICIDTVFNAEENGATVANHTAVQSLARRADGTWDISVFDKRKGSAQAFRSRAVLNAAGAWVDSIAASSKLGLKPINQGQKGSNIVVRLPQELEGIGFEGLTRGGAPYYVIPWGRLHYFGPANRPHEPDDAGYRVGEDEILVLLDELNYLFPSLNLQRRDVRYSWSGVRPRTARRGVPSGGSAVRLHDLTGEGAPNYFAYTGGLLMTHRSAGREVVEGIGGRLKPSGASRPFLGSARLPPTQADKITLRSAAPEVTVAGMIYSCQHEKVADLTDLMMRRVPLGWGERLGCDVAHEVAAKVREPMGWSAAEAAAKADAFVADQHQRFGLAS